jgi:hypothetical protein
MDKLLEMLGVQKLDEQKQDAIKEKLDTLIEVKAQETVNEMLNAEKDKLIEQYEEKFDDYKEDITSKFSNFVDEILDEQMTIPDKVLEYARKGELYSDLIEQFKVRLGVDEGLLDEEVKALLKEAKTEIQNLRSELDSSIAERLEVKSDAQELAAELYLRQKCDGLTVEQTTHVLAMLEGVKDREEIDRKFEIIVEAYEKDDEDDDEDDEDMKKKKMKMKKKDMDENDDEDEDDMKKKKMKKKDDDEDEDEDDEEENESLEEDSPFKAHLNRYMKVLKENKV